MTTSINSIEIVNSYADYWRYEVGANVIPADTRLKRPYIKWGQWQDKPIPEQLHNQWKSEWTFSKGMAVILGRVWHRQVGDLANYYLVGVDADNKKAIEEICTHNDKTITLQEFAATTLVEQHKDNPDKAHFYFYTTRPIRGKSSGSALLGDKISTNEIPAIEIKSLGSHGILYCSPSMHKDGQPYEIVGTDKPAILDDLQTNELEDHFDRIFSKYGIEYLSSGIAGKAKLPITELFKPGHKVLKGHNRHEDLLRVMESLISRNRDILSLEEIKDLAKNHNTTEFYEEALDDTEFEKQWKCAVRFIAANNNDDENTDEANEDNRDGNKTRGKGSLLEGKDRERKSFLTYKYSAMGKDSLNEAVILDSLPKFIRYDEENEQFKPIDKIEEQTRILIPPSQEECPYISYEFTDEELYGYIKRAKGETIESLYRTALSIVKKYIDQDEYKQILIATDIVWSYFQDRFGTTHYQGIVGDNGTGKSTVGDLFEAIAYRCVNTTNPSAANIFRVLGVVEPGQCTLVLDESRNMDESPDMMSILNTGYHYHKRVARVNTNILKQEFFWTYGLKVIIGEASFSQFKAKGVLDRTLQYNTSPGDPQYDIKETTSPQGDPERITELNKLTDFRKLMLIYRLINYKKPLTDIDIGIKGRNKELCKPYIQLFYGTSVQQDIEKTLQKFIDAKNEKKSTSLENIIVSILSELIKTESTYSIPVSRVWQEIIIALGYKPYKDYEGNDAYPEDEYHSSEYGTLYKNTVMKIIYDKLGADQKSVGKKRIRHMIFNPDKLEKINKCYNSEIKIKTVLKEEGSGDVQNEKAIGMISMIGSLDNTLDRSNESSDKKINTNTYPDTNNNGIYYNNYNNNENNCNIHKTDSASKDRTMTNVSPCADLADLPDRPDHYLSQPRNASNFYWSGSKYYCRDCKISGDKFYLQEHHCKGSAS
jgi:hypothetical protein